MKVSVESMSEKIINTPSKNILCIDIGGSKILVGVVNSEGKILSKEKYALHPDITADELVNRIILLCKPFQSFTPTATGVTIPGLADRNTGMWIYAPFSNIKNIPIADILSKEFNIPCFIENDVNACALAEKKWGHCKNSSDFLWMTVSNGIGGALFLENKLYLGSALNAGEIGHFIVTEDRDYRCGCGKIGCLEAVASGNGISKIYKQTTGLQKTAQEIAEIARLGNSEALHTFDKAAKYIGKALSYAVNLLNLPQIIIGGGVSESFDLLESGIKDYLNEYSFVAANKDIKIQKTGLGYYAALLGCAAICIERI